MFFLIKSFISNSHGELNERAVDAIVGESPQNAAPFVPKQDISLEARIQISAFQRDGGAPKHRSRVRLEVSNAWLLDPNVWCVNCKFTSRHH